MSIHSLHQWMRNLSWQLELLHDLLFWSIAFNGQCFSSCLTNTFSSNGLCITCHPDCATCSGSDFNQCKTCPSKLPVLGAPAAASPPAARPNTWTTRWARVSRATRLVDHVPLVVPAGV
jgi:hypothetical protein